MVSFHGELLNNQMVNNGINLPPFSMGDLDFAGPSTEKIMGLAWWVISHIHLYPHFAIISSCLIPLDNISAWDFLQWLDIGGEILLLLYYCTILQLYTIILYTINQYTIIQLYYFNMVLFYNHTIMLLCYYSIILLYYYTIILLEYYAVMLLYDCTIILLYSYAIIHLYYCTITFSHPKR